jgi:hypothetical protein
MLLSSTMADGPTRSATSFRRPFVRARRAHAAAERAAQEQRAPGPGGPIEYEDSSGRWHEEEESGDDRPDTEVKD